ncbi:MAG: metallophosphoesterase [Kiritimatiellae bacterium]|nr:metallophosphoesterase [Kiritimatiellia bacterium]
MIRSTGTIDRRSFIGGAAAFAALSGCASLPHRCGPGAADAAPWFEFGSDGEFRFLQITDLHLKFADGRLHPRVERILKAAFKKFRPSLLVLTGDNVSGQDDEVNAHGVFEKTVDPLLAVFDEYGVPFCVTFGNHDSERVGANRYTRQGQYDYYKSKGGRLFVDHDVPDLPGVGSGVVRLVTRGTRQTAFNLFVMDSGSYLEKRQKNGRLDYDACRTEQIAWYERVSGDVPCLWFQHIIVPDVNVHSIFVDAPPTSDAAAKEGPQTGYDMLCPEGTRRRLLAPGARGELKEHPHPANWATYRNAEHTFEGRTLYDSWRKMGNLKGAFFGHDHKNSYWGADENGIVLGATKCCSLWTYNDGNPGVRAFTVRPDGTYETQIFAESDI